MSRQFQGRVATLICAMLGLAGGGFHSASGQERPAGETARPYDAIQAGLDAYRLGEERRQGQINQQLWANTQARTRGGWTPAYGAVLYGGYAAPSLEYAYAYGNQPFYAGSRQQSSVFSSRTVFEPWPYVPGDIWGYSSQAIARQPIGQVQSQTGPRRWESHPIYDPPITAYQPLPPVSSPLLDKTPYASPRKELPLLPAAPRAARPAAPKPDEPKPADLAPAPSPPSPGRIREF